MTIQYSNSASPTESMSTRHCLSGDEYASMNVIVNITQAVNSADVP